MSGSLAHWLWRLGDGPFTTSTPQPAARPASIEGPSNRSVGQSPLEGEHAMKADICLRMTASLLLVSLFSGLNSAAQAQQGSLAGTVKDKATGEALENARVVL